MTPIVPTRTEAEALSWVLQDLLPLAERLGELERQGTAAPALAQELAAGLASASGAASRLASEHLHRWSRSGRRAGGGR